MMAAFLLGPHGVMAAEEDFGANLLASSPAPYSLNLGEGLNGLALRLHGADKSRVLTYNLAERRMEFSFDVDATNILAKRLFCLDLGSGDGSSSGPRLLGRDVDEQIVIDAPLGSPLSYLYNEVLFESTLDQDVRCFSYQTDDESELVFSLLGAPLPQPTLFSDRFELVPGLTISFLTADTDQPAQPLRSVARLSEAEDRLFPYRVRLSNKGTLNIEGISMQLLEMFDSVYDARFNDQDLVEVVCVPGSTVPGASCGSSVDNLTLRRHDIKLPPQSYVDFFLTRQIEPTSDLGQSIVLNAGAVTLETHNNRPIFAANTHEIILIGDGTWISAKEPQSAVLVSDSLADSHHLVEVAAWDSDPDAACTSNSADCSTPLQGLEIEITDICRVTAAPRGLSDCIPVDSSKVHFDSTAMTDEDGIARFKVASELADALRVTFTVTDDTLGTLALDSSRADQLETATVVTFLPDQPAGLGQISALTTAQAGENLGLEIEVVDRFGNRVGCDPDTDNAVTVNLTLLQILSSGGPIWVHEGQDFNCGLITFDNVAINRTGNGYEIRAGATGFNSVNTLPITITPGNPHQLNFQVQPSTVIAGQPIFPPVVVRIEDAFGNLTNSSAAVDLSLAADPSGEASLDGNTSTAVDGVASFPSLSVDRSGSGFLLEANSTDLLLATSEAFDVLASAPVSIALTGPAEQIAGEFVGNFTLTILDGFGNPTIAPSPVSFDLSSDATGSAVFEPAGPVTIATGDGSAEFTFSNTRAEATTVTASFASGAIDLGSADHVVSIMPAQAERLAFLDQPATATAGVIFPEPVTVEVQDQFDNQVASDNTTIVEIALLDSDGDPLGLTGTLAVVVSEGVATFSDLTSTTAGNDFRLTASAIDLTGADSDPFDINSAPGTALEFQFIPDQLVSGLTMTPPLEVRVVDSFGNTATDDSRAIDLRLNDGITSQSVSIQNAVAGIASFDGPIPAGQFGQSLTFEAIASPLFLPSSPVDVSVAAFSFDDFDGIQANVLAQASVGVDASASTLDGATLIRYRITLLDGNGDGVEGFDFTYCADGPGCTISETLPATDASGQSFFGPVTGITASDAGIVDPQGSSSLFQFEMESGEFSLTVELLEVDGFDLDWLGEGTTNFTVVD